MSKFRPFFRGNTASENPNKSLHKFLVVFDDYLRKSESVIFHVNLPCNVFFSMWSELMFACGSKATVLSELTAACLGYIFAVSHLFPWQHASQQQLFDNLRLPCKFYGSAGCSLGVAVHLKQLSQHVCVSIGLIGHILALGRQGWILISVLHDWQEETRQLKRCNLE